MNAKLMVAGLMMLAGIAAAVPAHANGCWEFTGRIPAACVAPKLIDPLPAPILTVDRKARDPRFMDREIPGTRGIPETPEIRAEKQGEREEASVELATIPPVLRAPLAPKALEFP